MNQLRDRLAAANPVPDLRYYSREQITATVSMIVSDAADHKTADEVRMPVAAVVSPRAPALNRSRRRWVYLVPVAAGLAALLAVVGLPGRQDSAYAGWTAMPTGVSVHDSAKVGDRCMATSKEEFGDELSRIGALTVVLAERRGQWTYALLANGNNVADCLQNQNTTVDTSIGQSSGSEVAPRPTVRGVTTITMTGSTADGGGSFWTAYGRAGTDVAKVVVNGPIGPVTATVTGGYWAAWWPGEDLQRYELIGWDKYSLTVTLRDSTQLPLIRPWPASKH
jgi:hypothetical protein